MLGKCKFILISAGVKNNWEGKYTVEKNVLYVQSIWELLKFFLTTKKSFEISINLNLGLRTRATTSGWSDAFLVCRWGECPSLMVICVSVSGPSMPMLSICIYLQCLLGKASWLLDGFVWNWKLSVGRKRWLSIITIFVLTEDILNSWLPFLSSLVPDPVASPIIKWHI